MDHYAADVAAVVEHLDLRNAVHIGHSTGGGEAAHYVAQHGQPRGRVAKLVLIGAVPPIMGRRRASGGLPIEVFDGLRKALAGNRTQSTSISPPVPSTASIGRASSDPGRHSELVAAGHGGQRQGASTTASRRSRDRLHRGSEDDHGRRRSSCMVMTTRSYDRDSAPLSAKLLKKGTL